jgi:hypothetical protein
VRIARSLAQPKLFSGYADPSYAASLSEFGAPRRLPRSGGWLLERGIDDTGAIDAMGCYPLFACQDWQGLQADLDEAEGLVCLSLVTDPFGAYDENYLRRCFRTTVVPFKQHFLSELTRPAEEVVSKHHRYYALKAVDQVTVERYDEPARFLDEWIELWAYLSARHDIRGMRAFSRAAFEVQLSIPGMVMLRATHQGRAVGAHLWFLQGDVAYSHLAASNALGYELMSSYALHWFALSAFAGEVRWLDLGGGAGLTGEDAGGLTNFKRGWTTETRTAYFCGRIYDDQKYQELVNARGLRASSYFPAYRDGEFR